MTERPTNLISDQDEFIQAASVDPTINLLGLVSSDAGVATLRMR